MKSILIPDHERNGRTAPPDDHAMQQRIRSLALTLNPDDEAPLRFPSRAALRAPLRAAQALTRDEAAPCPSAKWLLKNGRAAESLLLSLRADSPAPLPAIGSTARILLFARELTRLTDALITQEQLIVCLSAFDEVRALTMAEIQAAPDALAAALCGEYLRMAAESGMDMLRPRSLPVKSGNLSQWRRKHGRGAGRNTGTVQPPETPNPDHLLITLRMLDSLDRNELFRRVSRTEKMLLSDPSGTYPRMTNESRAQLRHRVSRLAKICSVDETTIARLALDAAKTGDGISREICWWLYTDAGTRRLLEINRIRASVRPLVPDPQGKIYLLSVRSLTLLLLLPALIMLPPAAAIISLPILRGAAAAIINALIPRLVRPRPLLCLKLDSLPDEYRTLTVLPALLSSPERARSLAEELETLGCLESDPNLSFLLLGDLPACDQPEREGDGEIIRAAEEAVSEANRRAGREKYYFLHRARSFQECEGLWMGRERKRGALNALHRLLLHGENSFAQPAALSLAHRFAFVLTLDAGGRMLPGMLHQMIGALTHPLNRLHTEPDGSTAGYSLLAPRMELPVDAVVNRFIALIGGRGGVDSYPTAVSDVYQDFCGQGTFGGKGIYDVKAFDAAVSGKLPDNLILSHDLIEGLLARAGFLCDVTLYEDHPKTVQSYLMRLNRWTRGDWQLLPLLFRRSVRLRPLDRYRLLDNLRRSLEPAAQLILLLLGFYSRTSAPVLFGLLPFLLPMILLPSWSRETGMRLLLRMALLPQEAACRLSGALRSLWRMTVSHKRLLQWMTADDADRRGGSLSPLPGWIASALLLPALVGPTAWLLTDVLLAALWWTGPTLFKQLEQLPAGPGHVSPADRSLLHDLAGRTFRFFADHISSAGLPPDNIQLEPSFRTAKRTSPTNIGLYLTSCVAARELGIISLEELARRAGETLSSLERAEKWHGHLYNWIDTETLEPLYPHYVSSVDSGNLAACLLLAARSLEREGAPSLARRAEALARGMDFTRLFDEKRKLFFIGLDAETGSFTAAHYDLLASESRLLSFTAIMLHQIPVSHWQRPGRAAAALEQGSALISWSGTMFEYLMPDLFIPVFPGTLLHQTQQTVICAQMDSAPETPEGEMPWGVSESGCYAFDDQLNYQYRAFGLPALALREDAEDSVLAPYASMLALPFFPEEAADNLRRMIDLNLMDKYGLFEAADCSPDRLPEGSGARIVKSHMAHHQGMILCAVCNALTDFSLVRLFMDRPEARALSLLLQEKPV